MLTTSFPILHIYDNDLNGCKHKTSRLMCKVHLLKTFNPHTIFYVEATSELEKAKVCLACDYVYDDTLEYKRHLRTVHGLKSKRFECFHCGKILQQLIALEKHLKRHHKNVPKPKIETKSSTANEVPEEKARKTKYKGIEINFMKNNIYEIYQHLAKPPVQILLIFNYYHSYMIFLCITMMLLMPYEC